MSSYTASADHAHDHNPTPDIKVCTALMVGACAKLAP